MIAPNIFIHRNDWNVISLNCKKYKANKFHLFVNEIAKVIKDETGSDPFLNTDSRIPEICRPRQLFIVMVNKHVKDNIDVASGYVDKDRCTGLHSIQAIKNWYDTDRHFRDLYDKVNTKVEVLKLKYNNA